MVASAIALVISVGARSVVSWQNYGDLNHNAPGTWLAMALDAHQGELYRPIVSEEGYGGTRYAPLFPIIIAGLMATGIGPITSGFVAGIVAAIVAVTGLFVLMRRLGADTAVAFSMAVLFLAGTTAHSMILAIRCDLLPLGLSLWGMAAVVWAATVRISTRSRIRVLLAAACFALAFVCKLTSVFGFTAAVIWLLTRRRWHLAAELCLAFALITLVFGGVIEALSQGRAVEILGMSASAGGTGMRIARGPLLMAEYLWQGDHALAVFSVMSLLLILAARAWKSLPAIFLILSCLGTMVIFGSPGTHGNHLVDMTAGAILVLAVPSAKTPELQRWLLVCCVALAVVAAGLCWAQLSEISQLGVKRRMAAAVADADRSSTDGPILSEAPLLPIMNGQGAYMLDPFVFRAIRQKNPAIAEKLWDDLSRQRFKAVILHGPADDPRFSSNEDDFGPGFIDRMLRHYTLSTREGDFYIFLPTAN